MSEKKRSREKGKPLLRWLGQRPPLLAGAPAFYAILLIISLKISAMRG